jgi:hypothetical protein
MTNTDYNTVTVVFEVGPPGTSNMTNTDYNNFVAVTCMWFGTWRHWVMQEKAAQRDWFRRFPNTFKWVRA